MNPRISTILPTITMRVFTTLPSIGKKVFLPLQPAVLRSGAAHRVRQIFLNGIAHLEESGSAILLFRN